MTKKFLKNEKGKVIFNVSGVGIVAVVSNGIKFVDKALLEGCEKARYIYLPSTMSEFEAGATSNMKELVAIFVDERNKKYYSEEGILFCHHGNKKEIVAYPIAKQDLVLELGNNVFKLGKSAFANNKYLEEIKDTFDLELIDEGCFKDCESLNNVILDFSPLCEIGDEAFKGCNSIESFFLPEGLKKIGVGVFSCCKALGEIVYYELPELTELSDLLFAGCEHFRFFDIPKGIKKIGEYAFLNCENLYYMQIPKDIKTIDVTAFSGCDRSVFFANSKLGKELLEKAFPVCGYDEIA